MKAVICRQYGPPEVLQISEVKKPIPKDGEILVKVHATTVTVADIRIRSFTVPASFWIPARIALGIRRPRKPILGVELAGEIETTGKAVQRFKTGDQIFAAAGLRDFGAYAEYICLREDGQIAKKPTNLSYGEAATIPIGAQTALHYLKRGKVQSGHKILIYGASGSVGTYAIQLAKYFGAEVTAVCSAGNFELVKSLGADKVIDYNAHDFVQQLEQYDVFLLAINKCPFSICNQALKQDGVYMNITEPFKSLPMLWTSLTTKKTIIMGENPPESAEDLTYLKDLIEAGVLKPVIDRSYTLDQIVEAHRYVDLGHKRGNVVVSVR